MLRLWMNPTIYAKVCTYYKYTVWTVNIVTNHWSAVVCQTGQNFNIKLVLLANGHIKSALFGLKLVVLTIMVRIPVCNNINRSESMYFCYKLIFELNYRPRSIKVLKL